MKFNNIKEAAIPIVVGVTLLLAAISAAYLFSENPNTSENISTSNEAVKEPDLDDSEVKDDKTKEETKNAESKVLSPEDKKESAITDQKPKAVKASKVANEADSKEGEVKDTVDVDEDANKPQIEEISRAKAKDEKIIETSIATDDNAQNTAIKQEVSTNKIDEKETANALEMTSKEENIKDPASGDKKEQASSTSKTMLMDNNTNNPEVNSQESTSEVKKYQNTETKIRVSNDEGVEEKRVEKEDNEDTKVLETTRSDQNIVVKARDMKGFDAIKEAIEEQIRKSKEMLKLIADQEKSSS